MIYTEQNIRGLAINFLRQHYKHRPRSGTSGTRVVSKVHYYQGVTIDARLAYQKPDLSWFTATVEATSLDRAHEVLYRVNYFRIAMHAMVFTLAVLAFFLALTQVQGESVWQWFGRPKVYLFLLTTTLVTFGLTAIILSRIKYYRYIYAIAQGIRVQADAQWVAFDKQIFENVPRRYYEELERQCIRFGFGLMEVGEENKVRWVIEPSHIDQFAGSRSRLPVWVAAVQTPPLMRRLQQSLPLKKAPAPVPIAIGTPPVPTDGLTDPLDVGNYLPSAVVREADYAAAVVPAKRGRTPWYKQPVRFTKSLRWKARNAYRSLYPDEIRTRPGYYELPGWLVATIFVLLLLLSYLFYEQSRWEAVARPGDKDAVTELPPLEPAVSPERSDASPELLPGEYDHRLSSNDVIPEREIRVDPPSIVEARVETDVIQVYRITEDGEARIDYDCLPLYQLTGTFYLLEEGRYPEYSIALERAEYLNGRYGIATTVALNNCVEVGRSGYMIYLGDILENEADANFRLRQLLRDFGLETEVLVVK